MQIRSHFVVCLSNATETVCARIDEITFVIAFGGRIDAIENKHSHLRACPVFLCAVATGVIKFIWFYVLAQNGLPCHCVRSHTFLIV